MSKLATCSLFSLCIAATSTVYAATPAATPDAKPAPAQKAEKKNNDSQGLPIYVGGGLAYNTPDDDTVYKAASGYQLYAGYIFDVKLFDMLGLSAEMGFTSSGDFKGKPQVVSGTVVNPPTVKNEGIWLAAVFDFKATDQFGLLARLGADFGDDDGTLLGAGISYKYSQDMDITLDYVIRDSSSSAQVNIKSYF